MDAELVSNEKSTLISLIFSWVLQLLASMVLHVCLLLRSVSLTQVKFLPPDLGLDLSRSCILPYSENHAMKILFIFSKRSVLTILFWLVATYIPSWLRISPLEVKSSSPWISMKKYRARFGIFWYALLRHPYRCWNSNVALNGCFFISATIRDWILAVSGSLSRHD